MNLSEKTTSSNTKQNLKTLRHAPLAARVDVQADTTRDIAEALNGILADIFALYLKTKNFHWHMSGAYCRDYHLLLDKQADQLFAMIDAIAEGVRKVRGGTLRAMKHISRTQRILDNDTERVEPMDMLAELHDDNRSLVANLRAADDLYKAHHDIASLSLIDVWIDETETRTWVLFEATRQS